MLQPHPPAVSVVDLEQEGSGPHSAARRVAWVGWRFSGSLFYAGAAAVVRFMSFLFLRWQADAHAKFCRNYFAAPGSTLYRRRCFVSRCPNTLRRGSLWRQHCPDQSAEWQNGRSLENRARPYKILVSPDGAHLLISSWAENTIYEHESGTGILTTKLRVGVHPSDMLWINRPFSPEQNGTTYAGRVFVAASGSNSVYSFGVTQDGQLTALDPVNVSMTSMHPLGMTPSALAVSDQDTRLYIACSDANAVAVADIFSRHPLCWALSLPAGIHSRCVHSPTNSWLS